jgi:hypothetical protein
MRRLYLLSTRSAICSVVCAAVGAFIFIGCASTGPAYRMGSDASAPENTNPDPAVWGADNFTFGKRMVIRSKNDFVFYFKHCGLIERRGPGAFYFQSEYGCTTP